MINRKFCKPLCNKLGLFTAFFCKLFIATLHHSLYIILAFPVAHQIYSHLQSITENSF